MVKTIRVKQLHPLAIVPSYAHDGDSGFDLRAVEDVFIRPGHSVRVRTGLAFEIPEGYEIQVRPRSGVTAKTSLRVQLGTIDSGYRGEVSVLVDNIAPVEPNKSSLDFLVIKNIRGEEESSPFRTVKEEYWIHVGDRIAQGVLVPVHQAAFEVVEDFEAATKRVTNGFGSTGII